MRTSAGHLLASLLALVPSVTPAAHGQGQPDIFNVEVAAADPGAGDLFACAMSLSEERTLVIASVLDDGDDDLDIDSGSIYVFRRQGGGFTQTAKLFASDGAAGHRLGFSVSIDRDGSRLAAGALTHDAAGESAGAAYVFRREGGGWVQEARLIPDALGPFDQLGHSIALSGDVLAVGAPGDDTRADAAGTVYVYERGANGWALAAMLTAGEDANANVGDGLGFSVALDGETLLAGAPFADDGLGAVHVFTRGAGGWRQVQRLTAPQRRAGALFGAAVALDGDRAVLGARLDDGAGDRAGAAWTFHRVGGAWEMEQPLPAPGLAPGDELGMSVALDGDALAVGARFDDQDAPDSGAVYRYRRRGMAWTFEQKLKAAVPAAGDEVGFALAVEDMEGEADDLVIAGAYRADSEAGPDSGLARLRVEGRNADLAITKSDGRTTAVSRDELAYEIRVRNLGPANVGDAAGGARVTDTFPAGLAGCSWTCTAQPGSEASCGTAAGAAPVQGPIDARVGLPAGTSVVFRATCTVTASAGSTITNGARVEPPEEVEDPEPDNNEAVDVTRITRVRSELAISKTAAPDPVPADGLVTYTIEVSNPGDGPAPGTRVTDGFLDFVDLPSEPPPCIWTCEPTGIGAACGRAGDEGALDDEPTLPPGTSVTYIARCTVPETAEGSVTNTAIARGPDNTVAATTETTVIPAPVNADVAVTLEVEEEELPPGTPFTVRATVSNLGPGTARDVELELPFPDLEPESVSVPPSGAFTCNAELLCEVAALAPGESQTVEVIFRMPEPDCADSESFFLDVVAEARASTPDPDPSNNLALARLRIPPFTACPAALRLVKGANPGTVASGGVATFNVVVINEGPETAFNAAVTDLLPPGLGSTSWTCTPSGGAECGAPTGTGGISEEVTLPPGSSLLYTLQANVVAAPCNTVTNSAAVSAAGLNFDPNPTDNTGSATVLVTPVNGTCASKTVSPQAQIEGGEVTYTILLIHGGPGTLGGPGIEFEDIVPSGLTVSGATANRGTVNVFGNTVTWDGFLDPGESVTLTITATVDPDTLGMEICNQGLVIPGEVPSDDPGLPGTEDPTCLLVVAFIPTLSPGWMALLAILLAALGLALIRRRT